MNLWGYTLCLETGHRRTNLYEEAGSVDEACGSNFHRLVVVFSHLACGYYHECELFGNARDQHVHANWAVVMLGWIFPASFGYCPDLRSGGHFPARFACFTHLYFVQSINQHPSD